MSDVWGDLLLILRAVLAGACCSTCASGEVGA